MKKVVVIFLALMMLLAGCGSGEVTQADYDALQARYDELKADYDALAEKYDKLLSSSDDVPSTNETPGAPTGDFDAESVISQLEITEYSYSSYSWYYAFLVIKNNSEFDIDISVSAKFYNNAGELVGAKNTDQDAFESGTETILYFMPDEAYAKMECELSVEQVKWYECVVSDLTYESVSAKDKEIVSVKNNGSEAAEYVAGYALFFKGDKVVGFNYTYFTDNDSELKPGKTITKEIDCYEDYDSVKFFFTGRRYRSSW